MADVRDRLATTIRGRFFTTIWLSVRRRPARPRSITLQTRVKGFGYFTYQINPLTKLSLITGVSVNNSEYPSRAGTSAAFHARRGESCHLSFTKISRRALNQDYYFGILALTGVIGPEINYQVAYTGAYSTIQFNPDPIGDLIYQGSRVEFVP